MIHVVNIHKEREGEREREREKVRERQRERETLGIIGILIDSCSSLGVNVNNMPREDSETIERGGIGVEGACMCL